MKTLTFRQVISRLKYGTMLTVVAAQTGKEIWNRAFPWHASVDIFLREVLDGEVSMLGLRDGGLLIEVITEDKATQAGEGKQDEQ